MNFSLSFKLPKFTLTRKRTGTMLEHSNTVWKVSIMTLLVLMIGFIAFDFYIFAFRTEIPADAQLDDPSAQNIRPFSRHLLDGSIEILKKRSDALERAGDNLPTRNPFVATGPSQ